MCAQRFKSRPGKEVGLSWKALKKEWWTWCQERAPILIFGAKFTLLILLLYVVLDLPFGDRMLYAYLKVNAAVASFFLTLLGQHPHLSDGVVIASPRFAIAVRRGCDAVEPIWLVCAAVLAFPAPALSKLKGILTAALVLQVLNIVRIVSLFWIGVHMPSFFNSAHLEVWPAVFILGAILLFLRWKRGVAA